MTETIPAVKIKTERPDEAEIRELAAKMVEANKAKALAASVAAARPPPGARLGGAAPAVGGQMGILNFLTRNQKPGTPSATEQRPVSDDKKTPAPDEASWKGHFGWDMLGKCHIPYIYRSGEKYVAVRMVEIKLLNKYLNYLHADIYSCTCIRSYYITEIEALLLNEINNRHCDSQFGREPFTQKDLVVRLSDADEFYNFLDVCYNKLLRGTTNNKDKCGFIRINKESVVPYTVRDNQKFVPLFYFEGETDNLKLKADQLKGWDLSYLKFCCKVQGIRNELFASETCSVISLSDIKSYFPPGTEFEEYWPNKVVDSQLLISAKEITTLNMMDPCAHIPSTSSTPMETEDALPTTSAKPTTAEKNALRNREYRKRVAAIRTPEQAAEFARKAAERQRKAYHQRKAAIALASGTVETTKIAQTSAQRKRASRQRQKELGVLHNPVLHRIKQQCTKHQRSWRSCNLSQIIIEPNFETTAKVVEIAITDSACHIKTSGDVCLTEVTCFTADTTFKFVLGAYTFIQELVRKTSECYNTQYVPPFLQVDSNIPILLCGDFNKNVKTDDSFLRFMKETFNLENLSDVSKSTTLKGTTIDLTFARHITAENLPFISYFSYHRPILNRITQIGNR
ncbi:unnamed protein product [Colias eurytheme]|nr:unnamed protein product [Colias eurytheme]